jgi:molybdopterin-containing oxidoreductase family iron-sulfur binding subunit
VEINPHTARALGIEDGDLVWVESPVGRLKVRARFYVGAMPKVINMPANQGHTAYGRWSRGIGVNPMEIVADRYDNVTGLSATGATRVKVYRA